MPRPSMATQRKNEILDALETCILKYGIKATSLENIAENAGVKRTILRHYIGNKDEIICALSRRLRKKYSQQWQYLNKVLPNKNRTYAIIDALFTLGSEEKLNATVIEEAIFSEAKRLEPIKRDQQSIMTEFLGHISKAIDSDFPNADAKKITLVSSGIYANYICAESLLSLNFLEQANHLKNSSKLLCSTLEHT